MDNRQQPREVKASVCMISSGVSDIGIGALKLNSDHESKLNAHSQRDVESTQHDTQMLMMEEDLEMKMDVAPISPVIWARLITKGSLSITYELTAVEPDAEGKYNMIVLGRSSQCNIRFETSPRISNRHCSIYCRMNRVDPSDHYLEAWIEDCSANGTFLNKSTKLHKSVPRLLRTGDEISLINPDLVRLPGANVTLEDVNNSSFTVVLELSGPRRPEGSGGRTVTRRQEMLENLQRGLIRSNTVIRLLDQQRNIHDYYEIREVLGQGAAGQVFRGIKKDTGIAWAVKVIDTRQMADQDASAVTKEAAMLRSIRHPNVIHLEDIFSSGHQIYLVLELSQGGDLFDRISTLGRYSEPQARDVMHQLLSAMAFLHERNITHRDLKPENILCPHKDDPCFIKVTDFGLAKVVDEKGAKTYCGTPQYFAPEVMERKYSVEQKGGNEKLMFQAIRQGRYNKRDAAFAALSVDAKDLLSRLLEVDPNKRISAAEALLHPFFLSVSSAMRSSVNTTTTEESSVIDEPMSLVEAAPRDSVLMPPPAPVPRRKVSLIGKNAAAAAVVAVAAPLPPIAEQVSVESIAGRRKASAGAAVESTATAATSSSINRVMSATGRKNSSGAKATPVLAGKRKRANSDDNDLVEEDASANPSESTLSASRTASMSTRTPSQTGKTTKSSATRSAKRQALGDATPTALNNSKEDDLVNTPSKGGNGKAGAVEPSPRRSTRSSPRPKRQQSTLRK